MSVQTIQKRILSERQGDYAPQDEIIFHITPSDVAVLAGKNSYFKCEVLLKKLTGGGAKASLDYHGGGGYALFNRVQIWSGDGATLIENCQEVPAWMGTSNFYDKTSGLNNQRNMFEGLTNNDGTTADVPFSPFYQMSPTLDGDPHFRKVELILPLRFSGVLYGKAFPCVATRGLQVRILLNSAERAIKADLGDGMVVQRNRVGAPPTLADLPYTTTQVTNVAPFTTSTQGPVPQNLPQLFQLGSGSGTDGELAAGHQFTDAEITTDTTGATPGQHTAVATTCSGITTNATLDIYVIANDEGIPGANVFANTPSSNVGGCTGATYTNIATTVNPAGGSGLELDLTVSATACPNGANWFGVISQQTVGATPGAFTGVTPSTSGSGTGVTLTGTIGAGGTITVVTAATAGTLYTAGDTVTIAMADIPGSTADAIFTLVGAGSDPSLTGGVVTAATISVGNGGSGYATGNTLMVAGTLIGGNNTTGTFEVDLIAANLTGGGTVKPIAAPPSGGSCVVNAVGAGYAATNVLKVAAGALGAGSTEMEITLNQGDLNNPTSLLFCHVLKTTAELGTPLAPPNLRPNVVASKENFMSLVGQRFYGIDDAGAIVEFTANSPNGISKVVDATDYIEVHWDIAISHTETFDSTKNCACFGVVVDPAQESARSQSMSYTVSNAQLVCESVANDGYVQAMMKRVTTQGGLSLDIKSYNVIRQNLFKNQLVSQNLIPTTSFRAKCLLEHQQVPYENLNSSYWAPVNDNLRQYQYQIKDKNTPNRMVNCSNEVLVEANTWDVLLDHERSKTLEAAGIRVRRELHPSARFVFGRELSKPGFSFNANRNQCRLTQNWGVTQATGGGVTSNVLPQFDKLLLTFVPHFRKVTIQADNVVVAF